MTWKPEPQALPTCVLCGRCDAEVKHGLIRFVQDADTPPDAPVWGSGPRCRDHDACHARAMDAGQTWLVDDGRPALPRPPEPAPPPAPAEPPLLDFGAPPEEVPDHAG